MHPNVQIAHSAHMYLNQNIFNSQISTILIKNVYLWHLKKILADILSDIYLMALKIHYHSGYSLHQCCISC